MRFALVHSPKAHYTEAMFGRRPLIIFFTAVVLLCFGVVARAQTAAAPSPLIIGTKETPPFAMKGPDGKWTGISIDLWRDMAAQLKLNYTFKEMDLDQLLAGVTNGTLTAAVAAISVTADREKTLDFTEPFFTTGLGIAVSDKTTAPWLGVLRRLFSWQFLAVVGLLVLVLLAAGFLVWLFERRGNAEQFGGKPLQGIGAGFWWSAVTMTTVGYGDKAPRTFGGRVVGFIWMFVAIVIISSFTAAITSALTVNQLGSSIHSPKDLPEVRVATVVSSTGEAYLRRQHIVYKAYPDASSALAALADDHVDAVVYDAPILQYLIRNSFHGRLVVLPHTFSRQDYAIAVPQGSPLREELNQVLEAEIRSPQWQEQIYSYLGEED
ncbi:MAG TPA: transporter substrate-binding domain-containing protein [Verrucomicrobiae bacterium]|nr:transporter substrate-binding domain-containing protein [Verrucomicrobiae bacterium]